MGPVVSRRTLGIAAGALAVSSFSIIRARGEQPIQLRCSLDTAPSHGRNVSIADYLKKLEAASGGKIKTELFQSGQLFPDLNVSKALVEGQVEMAAPGSWTLTGFVPDADLFQLPALYGRDIEVTHKVTDGAAGKHLAQAIETKIRSHVLGAWIDNGYQHWYTVNKKIETLADFKGLKIRSPGGAGVAWRIKYVGGIPNTTAWPNVPLALSQGTFDALISTDLSLVTAKLWDAGVKYGFGDRQFVGEYLPMVSLTFWKSLTPDLQKTMTDLWAENISQYRANMLDQQLGARKTLESHGIQFVVPTEEQTAAARHKMMAQQDEMAKEIHISPEMVKLVMADLGSVANA